MIRLPLRPRVYPDHDVAIIGDAYVSLVNAFAFIPVERFAPRTLMRRFVMGYVKAHAAILFVACPWKSCGAKVGDFCKGRSGQKTIGCHVDRIDRWHAQQKARPR